MAITFSVVILVLALTATGLLLVMTVRVPTERDPDETIALTPPSPAPTGPARLRLISRLLFARRSLDAITLDCTLLEVDGQLPPDVDPPAGLPFTLRLRCPDTGWFAGRVEELLGEWADENRELVLELAADKGKVRTTIASGGSSVHLELAGAAGLGADLRTA